MKQLNLIVLICSVFASYSNGQSNVSINPINDGRRESLQVAISGENTVFEQGTSTISVYPDNADKCESLQVTISGQNTNFGQGTSTTTVWFQQGSTTLIPDSISIISSTLINASFTFSQSDPAGYYDVYVNNSIDGTLIDYWGFQLFDLSNTYMYISPNPVCPNENINFVALGSSSFSYLWNFGDGSPTSSSSNTNHAYASAGSYPVWVKITDACGNDIFYYETVNVDNNLPVTNVYLDIFPITVCPGDKVNFEVWGSGNNSYTYQWNFGDGSPISNNSITDHTYTSAGSYPVWVRIINACGNDTILYQTVNVENNLFPNPNNYYYDVIPYTACPGDTFIFYVWPAGSGTYLWDFGDGNTTTLTYEEENLDIAKHSYTTAGNYTVNFTLTNGCGNSFTNSFSITVGNNIPVDGGFWWNDNDPSVGENIEFFAYGGSSYQWDFGDSSAVITTTSSLTPVTHSYSSIGTYTISVIITNSCGNSGVYTYNITIGAVGIQENKSSGNNLRIYPNPNNGIFSLETENTGKENMIIEIMNVFGQLTYRKQFNNVYNTVIEIDLSGHAKGMYFVKVQSDYKINVKPLIIN